MGSQEEWSAEDDECHVAHCPPQLGQLGRPQYCGSAPDGAMVLPPCCAMPELQAQLGQGGRLAPAPALAHLAACSCARRVRKAKPVPSAGARPFLSATPYPGPASLMMLPENDFIRARLCALYTRTRCKQSEASLLTVSARAWIDREPSYALTLARFRSVRWNAQVGPTHSAPPSAPPPKYEPVPPPAEWGAPPPPPPPPAPPAAPGQIVPTTNLNAVQVRASLEALLAEPYIAIQRRLELANLLIGFEVRSRMK